MDGISAAASIIALVQASQALGKAGKFLWSLRKIPEEIVSLRDELTSVEAVVGEATQAVRSLEASESHPVPGLLSLPTTSNTLGTIKKQAEELEAAAADLGAICARFQKSSASATQPSEKSTTTGKGKGKQTTGKRQKARQTFDWLREKSKIEPIRQRIKQAKDDLSLCLQALNTVQSSNHTRTLGSVERNISLVYHGTSQINNTTQASHTAILQLGEQLHSFMSEIERQQKRQLQQSPAALPSTLIESAEAISQSQLDITTTSSGSSLSYTRTTYRRRPCSKYSCPCQCHRTVYRSNPWPQAAQTFFGHLSLQYTNLPYTSRAPCNVESCRRPASTLDFSFSPPQWLLSRQLFVSASWGGLTSVGASLRIHVPIVPPDDGLDSLYMAAELNDIKWVQTAVATKTLLPSHVRCGRNIIQLAEEVRCNENILLFLVDQGFPIRNALYGRPSVSYTLREQDESIHSPRQLQHLSKFAQIAAEEENIQTTPIHDLCLGILSTPLDSILADDPSGINSLDVAGQTPMHHAIARGRTSLLERLLQHPTCNVHTLNRDGYSLLHYAAIFDPVGSTAMARLFLDRGDQDPDVAVLSSRPRDNGSTPLCFALHNPEMVKLLLERGARVAIFSPSGPTTPLIKFLYSTAYHGPSHNLTPEGFLASLKMLIKAGMDIEHRDMKGRTALLLAAEGSREAVYGLLECGARVDAYDSDKSNVLHCFARSRYNSSRGHFPGAAWFVDVDPDAIDIQGRTPLDIRKVTLWIGPTWFAEDFFPAFLDEIRALRASRQATSTGTVEGWSYVGDESDEEEDEDDDFEDAVETL